MKRTRIILAGILLSAWTLPAAAGNDRPIVVGELPAAAREFLRTHFDGLEVSYAKVDEDFFDKEYKVVFVNGAKVEFLEDGLWKELDCKYGEVPAADCRRGGAALSRAEDRLDRPRPPRLRGRPGQRAGADLRPEVPPHGDGRLIGPKPQRRHHTGQIIIDH